MKKKKQNTDQLDDLVWNKISKLTFTLRTYEQLNDFYEINNGVLSPTDEVFNILYQIEDSIRINLFNYFAHINFISQVKTRKNHVH